ncbi:MAG TPA: ABC transporter permease [Gemmatimonadaceae bacterium]|nr:ABC transporter permease [Gemmatimonadaceae bacterium]
MRGLIARLWHGMVVVAIVATATFVLVRLAPGDPFSIAFDNARLSPALRAQWRAAYGLDGDIVTQFGHWLTALVRGDLGWSVSMGLPVSQVIANALPYTLLLMGIALTLSFAIGMALGALQAARQDRLADRGIGTVTLVGAALPDFWLSLVILLGGAYWLRLFPVGGAADALLPISASGTTILIDRLRHLVLPVLTLVILIAAPVARQQRAALLDRLRADWVRTATAKGLAPGTVFRRHAWRTALGPVITLGGLTLPALVGGAVFVERVFAWPGMGRLAAEAVASRDYHLVVGCVLVGAVMVVIGSTLADLLAQRLDPRAASADDDTARVPA